MGKLAVFRSSLSLTLHSETHHKELWKRRLVGRTRIRNRQPARGIDSDYPKSTLTYFHPPRGNSRVCAFRQTPPSMIGESWQSRLSTDRRAPTSRPSPPRSRAGCMRPRTVGSSNCRVSGALHMGSSLSPDGLKISLSPRASRSGERTIYA